MGLFKPGWHNKNTDKALAAVGKLIDQGEIVRVVVESENLSVRKAAVAKITDQETLAVIAKNGKYGEINWASLGNLDHRQLEAISKGIENEWDIRSAALERITDRRILAELACTIGGVYDSLRLAAIKRTTDQSILAHVVKNDAYRAVRNEALSKLNDQAILTDVAINANERDQRIAAVKKLTAQTNLADIARNSKDAHIREEAIKKLTDKDLLVSIANNDESDRVRYVIVDRLTDQAKLADFALSCKYGGQAMERAIEKLTNQNVLAEIANSTDSKKYSCEKEKAAYWGDEYVGTDKYTVDLRVTAVGKLTDQGLLLDIARNGKSLNSRVAAVSGLTDQEVLVDIVKNESERDMRSAAVNTLTEQSMLRDISKDESIDGDLRLTATEKLADEAVVQEILVSFIKNKTIERSVRIKAVEKLSGNEILASITRNDEDEGVRETAYKRLPGSIKKEIDAERIAKRIPELERIREGNRKYDGCISAGAHHTVCLRTDGTTSAIGCNDDGQCNIESWCEGWRNITAVSAGYFQTIGLKSDGTVIVVGDNKFGDCDVQSWGDLVAVSAGGDHTVGLKANGTVVAVGDNKFGSCNTHSWDKIVAVSAGYYHTVGVKKDRSLIAIGLNKYGQCNVNYWRGLNIGQLSEESRLKRVKEDERQRKEALKAKYKRHQ